MPVAYEFNPDLIVVSAGFDAADGDPIGQCRVTPEGFAHMTAMLKPVAPLVLLLEGGYNLQVGLHVWGMWELDTWGIITSSSSVSGCEWEEGTLGGQQAHGGKS